MNKYWYILGYNKSISRRKICLPIFDRAHIFILPLRTRSVQYVLISLYYPSSVKVVFYLFNFIASYHYTSLWYIFGTHESIFLAIYYEVDGRTLIVQFRQRVQQLIGGFSDEHDIIYKTGSELINVNTTLQINDLDVHFDILWGWYLPVPPTRRYMTHSFFIVGI